MGSPTFLKNSLGQSLVCMSISIGVSAMKQALCTKMSSRVEVLLVVSTTRKPIGGLESWLSWEGKVASPFSKWQAKVYLACLFFYRLFARFFLFWRRRKGLEHFLKHYSADAVSPVTPSERFHFASFQKCQVCSLCTFSCTAVKEARCPGNFEPKFLMLGYGRSSHEAEYFLEEWLPCYECGACVVECPNDVPIHAMANEIISRRERSGFRKFTISQSL